MTKQTAWIPVRGQTTSRILKSYLEGSSGLWMSSMGCSNSGGGRSLPVTNSTGIDYQIDLLKLVWIGIWICSILGTPQRSDTQITLYRWTSPLSGLSCGCRSLGNMEIYPELFHKCQRGQSSFLAVSPESDWCLVLLYNNATFPKLMVNKFV